MNTKLITTLLLMLSIFYQAQNTYDRKNDFTVGPFELIAVPAFNVSYERLLNAENGIGVNVLFGGNQINDNGIFQISPFYRMYFGKKYASGFFLEGFSPINTGNVFTDKEIYNAETNTYHISSEFKNETSIGLGIGAGGKWVVKRNIIFEVSGGLGRKIVTKDHTPIVGRWMLGLGYRF